MKAGLTIVLTVSSSCVNQHLYGLRYLWHETPCLFKQASLYSGTDPNLPSPSYIKVFKMISFVLIIIFITLLLYKIMCKIKS